MRKARKNLFSAFLIVIVGMLFSDVVTENWLVSFGVTYIGLCVGDLLEMKEGGEGE